MFVSFQIHAFTYYQNKIMFEHSFCTLCFSFWFSYFVFGFRFKLVFVIVYFNRHVSWKSFCLHSFHAYDTYFHHCMGLNNPMTPINWFAHFICEQIFLIWGSQSGITIWGLESYGLQMGHSLEKFEKILKCKYWTWVCILHLDIWSSSCEQNSG